MKTCFISAPVNFDLSKLRQLLTTKRIKAFLPFEFPVAGKDFQEQISIVIQKADFCIGLLVEDQSQANVFFELGVASAMRKPILLVQEKQVTLPINLWGFPVARYDPPDFTGLSFFLDQFLHKATPVRQKPASLPLTKALSGRAQQLTTHLESLGVRATHAEIQNILDIAFQESGIRISAEPKHGDRRYDSAIWVEELDDLVGNPLLIEVKTRLSVIDAERIRAGFASSYGKAIGRALVVVYSDGPETALSEKSCGVPLVLFVSVRRLLAALGARSFGSFIRSERNRLVHGPY